MDKIQNILLIRLSSIGDVLQTTPVARVLKKHYPHVRLTWVVETKSQEIVMGNPYIDRVIVWDREAWERNWKQTGNIKQAFTEARDFVQNELRQEQYDLAIDLHGYLRTGLISYFSGAGARVCARNSLELSWLFANIRIPAPPPGQHVIKNYLRLIEFLGIHATEEDYAMDMPVGKEDRLFAERFFAEGKLLTGDFTVVLNPSTSWPSKCWPPGHYAALADWLARQLGAKVIVLGAASDLDMVRDIVRQMATKPVVAAGRTTLKQLAAILEKCDLFIGGDTGPLHIAAAVNTPTISLFGPTDPARHAPLGDQHMVLVKPMDCSPCYRRTCPHQRCLTEIAPEEVAAKVLEHAACKNRNRERHPQYKNIVSTE